MIRRGLKKLGKKLLRRPDPTAPAPRSAPQRSTAPAPYTEPLPPEEEEEELDLEVEAEALRAWVDEGREVFFVDIREPYELSSGHVEGALLLPMNQVPDRLDALPRDRTVIIYCAAGARSFGVTHYLREQGIEDTWSLVGGIGAWLQQGGQWLSPPSDAAFPLLTPVFVTSEEGSEEGSDRGLPGVVQAVRDEPRRYSVRLSSGELLDDLEEAALTPVGRRPRR